MTDTGISAYISLSSDVNKTSIQNVPENTEGVVSEKLPELTLKMSDDDLIKLADDWEGIWNKSPEKQDWIKKIDENEKYWLGKQHEWMRSGQRISSDSSRPMIDNLIFESLETYLPQVTRRNPEPIVELDESEKKGSIQPAQEKYLEKVKGRLSELADKNKLRLKLKKIARHWSIFHLGVMKFGWDTDRDIPIMRTIRPKKMILDPKSTIDEDGYNGNRIGEYRKMEAGLMLAIIGDDDSGAEARKLINEKMKGVKATELGFIEWWTDEMLFWKMDKTILYKKKNPHWNYDKEENVESVDDLGTSTTSLEDVEGINHLPVPKKPYIFLSVFNLGSQPMDETSLIQQNLSNQDLINKRNRQIDKNADSMNSGMVVSLARSGLTQPQAKGVTQALANGGTIVIPDGSPREAIDRYPAPGLPSDIFNQLADTRIRLRDIFGTSGSTPAGVKGEDTVRGKIQIRGLDTDRIGGGVSEYLEQFADDIYNYLVQLLYVYDSGFQFISGERPPKINVSVKEGSLLPKDSISIANQALELANMGRIANIDLYKRLEYPNPEELAANVWLEANAPQILYKDNQQVQEALAIQQPQPLPENNPPPQ